MCLLAPPQHAHELRAAPCCISSITPGEQWGFPGSPWWLFYRESLENNSSSGIHTLQILRGKCCSFITPCSRHQDPIVWFGSVNWHHQGFFSLLCCFYLNSLQHHLPPQEPDLRSQGLIISSPSSISHIIFLPALPELPISCLQLKHPFLKGLHAGFADIKSWWPLCSNGCGLCTVMVWLFLLCLSCFCYAVMYKRAL